MRFRSCKPEQDRGESSMAAAIMGAAIGSLLTGIYITTVANKIDDSNFVSPDELEVVTFSPEPGVECSGLSKDGTQVILSTVVCDFNPEV